MPGCLRRVVAAVVVATLAPAPSASQPGPVLSRVRPIDPQARELLLDGWRSSETMRGLIETLEESDLIVQVETQKVGARFRGQLRFMTATEECRYVRVSIRVPGARYLLLPVLAHELQHAVEIAQATDVMDEESAEALLHRIGWEWQHTIFETEAALMIEQRVLVEIGRRW
jgi:hypothetical protein